MICWIIHIALLAFASMFCFRYMKNPFNNWVYWAGLILKLSAGIMLGLIFYEKYQLGDTIQFFELAKNPNTSITNQPRTYFFIQFLKPIVFVTGESYWITSLWLSFISFISAWYAATILANIYPKLKIIIALSLLFIPSVVFWSSGVLKDTIIFACLSMSVALLIKLYNNTRISFIEISLLLLSAFILFKIKHYIFITLLLFGSILTISVLFKKLNTRWKWIISCLAIVGSLSMTQFVHPYLRITRIPQTLFENNQAITQKTSKHNQLDIILEDSSWQSVFSQIPRALHIGLFRPSVFDQTVPFGWAHRIENFVLTILIVLSILLYFKLKPKINWLLMIASIACILLLATMLPLSSPNFGTLVRYKNAYIPYLFLISSILPYRYFTSQTE